MKGESSRSPRSTNYTTHLIAPPALSLSPTPLVYRMAKPRPRLHLTAPRSTSMSTFNQPPQSTRDPKLIKIMVSHTLWADLQERVVFGELAQTPSTELSGGFWVHWCERDFARRLLEDAKARQLTASGHLIKTYRSFIERLEAEMDEATVRPGWLQSDKPRSLAISVWHQRFVCTTTQLKHLDAPTDLKLPGMPGGPKMKATFVDSQGRRCVVLRADKVWPGTFFVEVKTEPHRETAESDDRLEKLKAAPQSPDSFIKARLKALDMAEGVFQIIIDPGVSLGYAFSSNTNQLFQREVIASFARLRAILERGEVVGEGPLPLLNTRRSELAKQDRKLQGFLRLVHTSTKGAA